MRQNKDPLAGLAAWLAGWMAGWMALPQY